MLNQLAVTAIFAALAGSAMAQDAKTVITDAQKALGNLTSITYSGSAKDVAFQQCGANSTDMLCRGQHDPMRPIADYVRVIDLAAPTSRATGATMNISGGASTALTAGNFSQQITPQQAAVDQPWNSSLEFYITPWGFLKGAAANNATAKKQGNMTVLSWSPTVKAVSGKSYTINGYINSKNLVDHVETWLGENIMGDMHIVQTYTGWKDMGGVIAPTKIVQTRGGLPFFDVDVKAAKANPPDLDSIAPPPAGRGGGGGAAAKGGPAPGGAKGGPGGAAKGGPGGGKGGPAPGGAVAKGGPGGAAKGAPGGGRGGPGGGGPMEVTTEQLGDGLYRLTTGSGSYDSVVVEFKDYIMMLEAGQSIARGEAYVAKTHELFPNKPIKYVMNTHPHADHTGGLPALVAEGAIIITHKNNEAFLKGALNTPRTLLDDVLAKNPKPAVIEPIGEKKVYSDATRTVEMHHIPGAPHSNGLIIAYFPKEKIIFQGDFSLPAAGQPAPDHLYAMVPVVEKLKLDYDRYINVHAPAAAQHRPEVMAAYDLRVKEEAANKAKGK